MKEQQMPLLNVVVFLIVVGVGLFLINRFIPMASSIKTILNVVVVVVVCVWLLQAVGLWSNVSSFRLTR
ncbi:MAG TPA: Thivi_2564 family membrane protein [Paludibaculum sp.]